MIYYIVPAIIFGLWYFARFFNSDDTASAIESLQSNENFEDNHLKSETSKRSEFKINFKAIKI